MRGLLPKLVKSPLNYQGGKYKLLPQILHYFPRNINTFVDLFSGGCNVGININCNKVIFNDIDENLINIFKTFKELPKNDVINTVYDIIKTYNLSYYASDINSTSHEKDKTIYLKLRDDFNSYETKDHYYYLMLYVLTLYSFNNSIRFNKNGQYNVPSGKRNFNTKLRDKLYDFLDKLQSIDCEFCSQSFETIDTNMLSKDDFIYVDPPYLISNATYNNIWNEDLEKSLYNYLDNIHSQGLRFALSNVLTNNDKENIILKTWLDNNSHKYKTIHLDYSYANSNYHRKNKNDKSDEILVINY